MTLSAWNLAQFAVVAEIFVGGQVVVGSRRFGDQARAA